MPSATTLTNTDISSIHIIGAGIGGLSLSRCLQKHGIRSVLYERKEADPKRNGYGITLHERAWKPLLDFLGTDTGTLQAKVGIGRVENGLRVNRARFEGLLSENVDVKWGCGVENMEKAKDHRAVTIKLTTGDTVVADEKALVVAADGVHSTVRKALLPDVEVLQVLPYVAFNGKRRIPRDVFEEKYAPHMRDSSIIELCKGETLLHISLNESVAASDKVSISWIYSRPARGPKDALHKPNRPNAGASTIPTEFFDEISGLRDLPAPFADVFNADVLREERILHWLMRTSQIEKQDLLRLYSGSNVLFIGDSSHAQPILGGQGANEAILDGIGLAVAIVRGRDAVERWYDSRIGDWQAGVEESRKSITKMHGGSDNGKL